MGKYTYEGNLDPTNTADVIKYGDQEVSVGGTIELSDEEQGRLSQYFLLTNAFGDTEVVVPPVAKSAPVVAPAEEESEDEGTSGSASNISTSKSSASGHEKG